MERTVIIGLEARGVDVTTAAAEGLHDASDDEQLDFARSQRRVLVTYNVSDFPRIHYERIAASDEHAGIVIMPQQRYSIGERIRRLLVLLSLKSAEQMDNQIEYLSNWEHKE